MTSLVLIGRPKSLHIMAQAMVAPSARESWWGYGKIETARLRGTVRSMDFDQRQGSTSSGWCARGTMSPGRPPSMPIGSCSRRMN